MNIDEIFKEPLSKRTEHLLQIYREAIEKAEKSSNLDEKILAYGQVINFCMDSKECKYNDSIKRNEVLYWAYKSVADVLTEKACLGDAEDFNRALVYLEEALKVARNETEKLDVLNKTAAIYKTLGNYARWADVRYGAIELFDLKDKRRAYFDLSQEVVDVGRSTELLESALEHVTHEDASVFEKCQNTIEICNRLIKIYQEHKNNSDLMRIQELYDKAMKIAAQQA